MKRLALMGANGMLGTDLRERLKGSYHCIPVNGRRDLDIANRAKVLRWIEEVRPEILINTAAYTDVDGCETHGVRAMRVNGTAPGYLAEACARIGALMVQVSTDFVFDGARETPYDEEAPVNPLSVYGASKLLGEQEVATHLDRFLIVRASWLYGIHGRNFVEAILSQAEGRGCLRVVHDQIGSPTYVPDLSQAVIRLLEIGATGTVHVANAGACSWFDFARKILELSGHDTVPIERITSAELNRAARRPVYSALSCERYVSLSGHMIRPWEEALQRYLQERLRKVAEDAGC
jgi:dTDP-4-dehydrorhamnose reductase